jgi:DNA-binding CsgD family transcriptional regulator
MNRESPSGRPFPGRADFRFGLAGSAHAPRRPGRPPSVTTCPRCPTMTRPTKLTATEREVLDDVARGLNNIQIGLKQFRSTETIRTHMKNIFFKLKARNRAHAVAIAYDTGILDCRLPHLPLTQPIPPRTSPPPCRRGASPTSANGSAAFRPAQGGPR